MVMMRSDRQIAVRLYSVLGVLLALCIASVAYLLAHAWHLPLSRLFDAPHTLPIDALVVQVNILPRLVMALLSGAALGVSALLLQQVTHNPLASDHTLAVSSGAQLALLLVSIFMPQWLLWRADIWSMAGAALSLLAVFALSGKTGATPVRMVLSGLVVNLYLGSVAAILMLFFMEESRSVMQWGSGSLVQDGWQDSLTLLWRLVLVLVIIVLMHRPLSILGLSDEQSRSLGVPVKKIRFVSVCLVVFLCASVVSLVGILGFIGLAAAAIVRQIGVRHFLPRLIATATTGALLLLLTDSILQSVELATGWLISTGAVAAVLGAPILLWLIFKSLPASLPDNHHGRVMQLATAKPWLWVVLLIVSVGVSVFVAKGPDGWLISYDSTLLDLHYPRMLAALSAGLMLATAGVILQRLTHNVMASPELLGVSAGAAMGILLSVLYGIGSQTGVWVTGVAGAIVTMAGLMWINRKNNMQPEKVLLTGMVIVALFDAVMRLFLAAGHPRMAAVMSWMSGTTYPVSSTMAITMTVIAIALLIAALLCVRVLDLFGLGSTVAASLGLSVVRYRYVLIVLVAVLAALSTMLVGPLSFVGLLAPHMAKMMGFRRPAGQLAGAALIGMTMFVFSDWVGRYLVFPYEIPAGLMAALVGGSYFFILMRKM
jgi:ABC-type Fe3+-siderophore transport system permease subunit